MTRLGFTADLHCDDYGSKVDPATGLNARWIDTVGMARWVAADAEARGCGALVIGGDLTESRHPAPWRVAQIGDALSAFRRGPTIYVRGNHDGIRSGSWIGDVLSVVPAGFSRSTSFAAPGIRLIADLAIAVIPYLDRHHLRALPGFEALSDAEVSAALGEAYLTIARGLYAEAKESGHEKAVLVVHQALAGGQMSDAQAAFLGDQGLVVDTRALGAIGFDAILAGHFHKHQVLQSEPLIAYSGSPYRTDFGEEHQPKGYLVVDVDEKGVRYEFVETPARRFVTLTSPRPDDAFNVHDAVVRAIDVDPDVDVVELRRVLEADGAFDVQEIRIRPQQKPNMPGGLAEGLTAHEALEAYFEGDPDAKALIERGRAVLAEVL